MAVIDEIKKNKSKVFRRCYVKRRIAGTGLFEDNWLEVTDDVKKWGSVVQKIDQEKQGRIRFSSVGMKFANDDGKYSPEDNTDSLWFGYATQQRTLVRIDAGFVNQSVTGGVWTNTEFPDGDKTAALETNGNWSSDATMFIGLLQGDIGITTKNEMAFKIKPLNQIFRDYPAKNLTGFTSTGLTGSQFMEMLRDQTDGSSNFIFRPFFGDTTSNWNIQTTTINYATLDSAGSSEILDKNIWQVIEKIAEAENYLAYVDNAGVFNFIDRANISSTTTYEFRGIGYPDRTYGIQIKDISYWGFRHSKYYSRVQLKHGSADTTASYSIVEATHTVAGDNNPWLLGHRTYAFENIYLSATSADTLAQTVFNNVSSAKKEIQFNSSFVPQLSITDRLSISYDASPIAPNSVWDQNLWAETAGGASNESDLVWYGGGGNSISLLEDEYSPLSVKIDLDKLETIITAREL